MATTIVEEHYNIQGWRQSGTLNEDGVLRAMSPHMRYRSMQFEPETIRRNFDSLCQIDQHGNKFWGEAIFIQFLATSAEASDLVPSYQEERQFPRFSELPVEIKNRIWFYTLHDPVLVEAAPILYRSALYFGSWPFQPRSNWLTYESLERAVFWLQTNLSDDYTIMGCGMIGNEISARARTQADRRRVFFQSLATCHGEVPDYDVHEARRTSEHNALFEFSESDVMREFAVVNYDEDGDEMFHDVIDTLTWVQPDDDPGRGVPSRNSFRTIAKAFHASDACVRKLSIPTETMKSLIKLLISQQRLDDQTNAYIRPVDLDRVADHVTEAFSRGEVITWTNFDKAWTDVAPCIFNAFHRLFAEFSKHQNTTEFAPSSLPKPGRLLTVPVLGQLGFILAESVEFDDVELLFEHNPVSGPCSPSNIVSAIESASYFGLVLVSGTFPGQGEHTWGAFIATPKTDAEAIRKLPENVDGNLVGTLIFQLGPVHEMFKGLAGKKAWIVEPAAVWFGDEGRGTAIGLLDGLRKAKVVHKSAPGTYTTTAWRGEYELELDITRVEVWGSC